ncbi:hypothetical protein D3C76_386090 [compost metagenome]
MALVSILQLSNSEGLMKVVIFTGLSHPVIIYPHVHGEPALTAQAFYYLEDLESAAKIRFETGTPKLSDQELEYLIDNYLFEYSKAHPEAMLTFKISKGKFWEEDFSDFYLGVDQNHTLSLAVDVMNDASVQSVSSTDENDKVDLRDWDIGRNYVAECFRPYMEHLTKMLDKKVEIIAWPSDERDGYMGKLRVIKPGYGLISYSQAMALESISIDSIPKAATSVALEPADSGHLLRFLPIERIQASAKYNPVLLSHYYSGLKEHNPLKSFVGFYNVLEYYFEEAPRILVRTAASERLQLGCVVDLLVSETDILAFLNGLRVEAYNAICVDLVTSSGVAIKGLNPATELQAELARWLYEIRCAVIHSKKTRKGSVTATFEPYSAASQELKNAVSVIQWLAIRCIEKDFALSMSAP